MNAGVSRSKANFLWLLRYTDAQDKAYLVLGLVLAAGAGVINPVNVLVFRDVVNNFISDDFSYATNRSSVILFTVLGTVMLFVAFTQAFLLSSVAKRLSGRLNYLCFLSLMKKSVSWFDEHPPSDITNTVSQHLELIEQSIGYKLGEFVQNMCGLFVGVIVAFSEGWKLSLVASAILPVVLLVFGMFGFVVSHVVRCERVAYAKAKTTSEDVLQAIRTVFNYGTEQKEAERYANELKDSERMGVNRSLIVNGILGSTGFAFFAAAGLIFWYGVRLMIRDGYKGGAVVTVFINILLGSVCLGNALPNLPYFKAATEAARDLFELIESNDQPSDTMMNGQLVLAACTISMQDVTFAYPTRPDNLVLRNINLTLPRYRKLALVGPPASGKSTLLRLLVRFYEPTYGIILVSDLDAKSLDIGEYRNQVGYVDENPTLFEGTIEHNIRLGKLDATEEQIKAAAKLVNLHEPIIQLRHGYDAPVEELTNRNRIAYRWLLGLARAMVRNPSVLLMDYTNVAVNAHERNLVHEAIQRSSQGRTVAIASQNPAMVKDAYQIVVLDKGFIREMGNFDELMANESSLYAAMLRVQEFTTSPQSIPSRGTSDIQHIGIDVERGQRKSKKKHRFCGQSNFLRTLKVNKPEVGYLIGGCISSFLAGAAQPSFAVLYSEVFDIFTRRDNSREMIYRIEVVSGMMVLVGIFRLLACLGQGYFFGVSGEKLIKRLRSNYFASILEQEITWFESPDHSVEALTYHLADTITHLRLLSGIQIGTALEAIALIIVSVAISISCSWELTLVAIVFIPLTILGGLMQFRRSNHVDDTQTTTTITREAIFSLSTVHFLNLEDYYAGIWQERLRELNHHQLETSVSFAVIYAVTQSAGIYTSAAVFELGAHLFTQHSLSVLNLFRAFAIMNMGAQSIGKFFSILPELRLASMSAKLIFSTLDKKPTIPKDQGFKPDESAFSGKIKFNHVTLSSPSSVESNHENLQNFVQTIDSSQAVGFVGQPGCGTAEILDLVQRFHDPSPPEDSAHGVYFDQWNARDLAPCWIRSQSALIAHDSWLFNRTIKDNIAYGAQPEQVTIDHVIEAARMANIHDFINTLPDGYNTIVNRDGFQLSEGQQRRIALARALFHHPKLLLVDKPTMGLDVDSQHLLHKAIYENIKKFTTLVIPYQYSHLDQLDRIVVLRSGRQVEIGSFEELLQSKGYFYSLHRLESLRQF